MLQHLWPGNRTVLVDLADDDGDPLLAAVTANGASTTHTIAHWIFVDPLGRGRCHPLAARRPVPQRRLHLGAPRRELRLVQAFPSEQLAELAFAHPTGLEQHTQLPHDNAIPVNKTGRISRTCRARICDKAIFSSPCPVQKPVQVQHQPSGTHSHELVDGRSVVNLEGKARHWVRLCGPLAIRVPMSVTPQWAACPSVPRHALWLVYFYRRRGRDVLRQSSHGDGGCC